ncbi:ABC transporter ATP-binding protein [Myxacorys almedinensis]|uniref:ABC-type quaternary amine transporter n=1 Tax=Myxacorys almedinensis A TaxID=2690445 RepID=A0A8J8CMT8_9CYAN|nr:ABC transporter ATP-binding protein [Myxacorys almedinensis]NDJ17717.1 ATP-binding cassette domain-containing protein [Myxacorys almedinensis A]
MPQSVILHLDDVSKQFSGNWVVQHVSLKLHQGELLGLLGPSGCGKTTLLRLIAGFEQPQNGTIDIAGQRVAGSNRWQPPERRDVGMVFQDYALFPHLNVAENIGFGLGRDRQKTKERISEAIALVGLTGFEKRYPHELSGGQQQRVALARAIAPQPSLILLDEPLSNLDLQVRLRLRQEIRTILKATGMSAVFVTHDQEEALSLCDRVAVMRQGQVEQFDTPEAIYQTPASQFVAEFVTQANFLPATRQGDLWHTEIGAFKLSSAIAHSSGLLMVRQQALALHPDETGTVVIRDRQFLGREHRYVVVTPSGQHLQVLSALHPQLAIDTPVKVQVNESNLQIFA